MTVTAVAALATLGFVGLVAEMLGELGLEHPLHQSTFELLEDAFGAEQILRVLREFHELREELGLHGYGHR